MIPFAISIDTRKQRITIGSICICAVDIIKFFKNKVIYTKSCNCHLLDKELNELSVEEVIKLIELLAKLGIPVYINDVLVSPLDEYRTGLEKDIVEAIKEVLEKKD